MQSQEGSSDIRRVTNSSRVHYRRNNGLRMRKDMHFRFVRVQQEDPITELFWKDAAEHRNERSTFSLDRSFQFTLRRLCSYEVTHAQLMERLGHNNNHCSNWKKYNSQV